MHHDRNVVLLTFYHFFFFFCMYSESKGKKAAGHKFHERDLNVSSGCGGEGDNIGGEKDVPVSPEGYVGLSK